MDRDLAGLCKAAGVRVFERGWLSSNNILFEGDANNPSILVDSGYASHAEQSLALVRQSLGAGPLNRIINTHLHSDHCGGNLALQQAYGCEIDVPAGENAKVDAWDTNALTYADTGQHCPRFRRTGSVRAGDTFYHRGLPWHVKAAPGHDPESVILYQPDLQLLISADALWENGFGVVFPELEGANAFGDVHETLEQISQLPVRWVIPGHGAPFTKVDDALSRARRRLEGFVSDPSRHAKYAAKVLVKFHLLEQQSMPLAVLDAWLRATPYLRLCQARDDRQLSFEAWAAELLKELETKGAIRIADGAVLNR